MSNTLEIYKETNEFSLANAIAQSMAKIYDELRFKEL